MKKKKVLVLGLAIMLGSAQMLTVSADTIEEVQQQQQQTEGQLSQIEDSINDLEDQKEQITGEIDSLDFFYGICTNGKHLCTAKHYGQSQYKNFLLLHESFS